MQESGGQEETTVGGKPISRKALFVTGVAVIVVILACMVAALVFLGLQTKNRISDLDADRVNAVAKAQESWGVIWEEGKTPNKIKWKDLYKIQLITAESIAVSARYQAMIDKTGDRFAVAASIILAIGLGAIGLVVLIDLYLLFRPEALPGAAPGAESPETGAASVAPEGEAAAGEPGGGETQE